MVSHHPVNFEGNRNCFGEDIMVLLCHVILQDHLVKMLSGFMSGNLSQLVTTLQYLIAMAIVVVEI